MLSWRAVLAALVSSVFVAASAAAQPAMISRPVVAPLAPIPLGQDTLAAPDARDALVLEPLRLDLLGPYVPHPFNTRGCEGSSAGVATGQPGFPFQGAAASGLNPAGRGIHAPRLTLFGFSRGGCAIDAAVGGGAAISLPIEKDVFFAWSAGAIYLPAAGAKGQKSSSVRADIVVQRPNGRAYTMGIGVQGASPRVSFGGIF